MSSTYSAELAVSHSALSGPECAPSPFASETSSAGASLQSTGPASRATTTSDHSACPPDQPTLFAGDFPVSLSPRLLEAAGRRRIYGRICAASSKMSDPFGSLLRMSIASTMNVPPENWKSLITPSGRLRWTLHHAADDMSAAGLCLWPTPTRKANHDAPSMRKWPSHKAVQDEAGGTTPRLWEWMMGFPPGWTECDR